MKFWGGSEPTKCEIPACSLPITTVFFDAKTIIGQWGKICPSCFVNFGVGLGTGKGQKYVKDRESGKFLKTEG